MIRLKVIVCLLLLCSIYCLIEGRKRKRPNLRPVIGIVSQKVTIKFTPYVANSDTYIAASYVKFLEMAGAQVIPILPSYSDKKILRLMKSINGMLFPGGSAPLFPKDSGYARVTELVFKAAKHLNNEGVYFPIMGICLGFETLHALASHGKEGIISSFDAENMPVPLNLTKHAFESRLFENLSKQLMQALMFEEVTLNMHQKGISPDIYRKDKDLMNTYRVLSTNLDFKGKEFVSTVEGVEYPFYGLQWHPEKNIFEWTRKEKISHWSNAIQISQQIANFFVDEARKNNQHFKNDKDEIEASIFGYAPTYSGGTSLFEQVYVFGNNTEKLIH